MRIEEHLTYRQNGISAAPRTKAKQMLRYYILLRGIHTAQCAVIAWCAGVMLLSPPPSFGGWVNSSQTHNKEHTQLADTPDATPKRLMNLSMVSDMKLMRVLPASHWQGDSVRMAALLLDSAGNAITGLADAVQNATDYLRLTVNCLRTSEKYEHSPSSKNEYSSPISVCSFREISLHDSPHLSLVLCTDNAAYMARHTPAIKSVYQTFLRAFGQKVEKMYLCFDHRLSTEYGAKQEDVQHAQSRQGENATRPFPSAKAGQRDNNVGLTALYRAAYQAVINLQYSARQHKVLVLVSGGADDASLLYTLRDVLDAAQKYGVTIYTIAFGSGADTYSLRAMAQTSGGKMYVVDDDAPLSPSAMPSKPYQSGIVQKLDMALAEIAASYRYCYEITATYHSGSNNTVAFSAQAGEKLSLASKQGKNINADNEIMTSNNAATAATNIGTTADMMRGAVALGGMNCTETELTLALSINSERVVQERVLLRASDNAYFPKHQIIATFRPHSTMIDEEFEAQISTLGETLKDNPNKVIELIGHADLSGSDAGNRITALRRSHAVKKYLALMGVNPAQVRVRSVGREKPIFSFEREEWQARTNRRVELRWLDPALVPFEILAQTVTTEDDAFHLETEWTLRGYDAYYEACFINRIPAYRVKLWGFPTLQRAEQTRAYLQQKYKMRLVVQ